MSNTPGHPDLRPCTACAAVATPGDNHWFRFPTAAHRELQLDDVSQVDEIIRRLKEGESEFYACSRSDAARYIKGQIEAGDPDWANFLTHHAKRTKWKALADKG